MEEVMRRIQERMGHSPKLEIEEFENWAGTYNADVISCSPTSKEEIQKVIEAAKEEGVKLRCAGSQHSWSPVFSDDRQLLLKLGKVRSDYGHGAKIRISNVSDPDISKHHETYEIECINHYDIVYMLIGFIHVKPSPIDCHF